MGGPIQELAISGLSCWRWGPRFPISIAAYLVSSRGESVLIDALVRTRETAILRAIDTLPGVPRPQTLVFTHCHGDHTGSGQALMSLLAADAYCGGGEQ